MVEAYIGPGTCCVNDPGEGGGGCQITPPTNLKVQYQSDLPSLPNRSAKLTWNAGIHLQFQMLFGAINETRINNWCPGATCLVAERDLDKGLETFTTPVDTLPDGATGRVYWWQVTSWYNADCNDSQRIADITACPLNPTTMTLDVNESMNLNVNIEDNNEIDRVTFAKAGNTDISLSQNTITDRNNLTDVYEVAVTGNTPTSAPVTVTVKVYLESNPSVAACTNTMTVTVNEPPEVEVSGAVRLDDARAGWGWTKAASFLPILQKARSRIREQALS